MVCSAVASHVDCCVSKEKARGGNIIEENEIPLLVPWSRGSAVYAKQNLVLRSSTKLGVGGRQVVDSLVVCRYFTGLSIKHMAWSIKYSS